MYSSHAYIIQPLQGIMDVRLCGNKYENSECGNGTPCIWEKRQKGIREVMPFAHSHKVKRKRERLPRFVCRLGPWSLIPESLWEHTRKGTGQRLPLTSKSRTKPGPLIMIGTCYINV